MLSRPLAHPAYAAKGQHTSTPVAVGSMLPAIASGVQHPAARRGHALMPPGMTTNIYSSRWALKRGRQQRMLAASPAARGGGGGGGTDEEPDWEAEMSIFKQRISRPNQLATLRELEAKVSVGKVLYARDGLAIVAGLNTDAPLGTKVSFATGTAGVLLWHRSDNLSFCLVLGDPASVTEGTPVECKIKGVLQVVDDVKGPITRKDFELFNVPTGDEAFGRVHDHIGRQLSEYDVVGSSSSTSTAASAEAAADGAAAAASSSGGGGGGGRSSVRPLLNSQVEMKNREQINEPLITGVKALDILTPLGRGASLLVIGPAGAGKTRLALDAIAGQALAAAASSPSATPSSHAAPSPSSPSTPTSSIGAGVSVSVSGGSPPVRCVLALVGRPKAEVQALVSLLRSSGSLSNTAVVVADEGAPLGHQYAAMCCACSIGERVRDEGGHSLVVVDDIKPLSDVWEQLLGALAGLGSELLREGLVKDDRGRDMPVVPPKGAAAAAGAAGEAASAAAAAAASMASAGSVSGEGDVAAAAAGGEDDDGSALVEYEGMLVSGAVAQRRGFLSTFFMRAAKMSRSNGGGSMSLMPLVPGTCATGVSRRIDMSKYKTLSPEQLAKLEAALRAKQLAEELASSGSGRGELATEVVEEFISIADGQVVLQAGAASSSSPASPGGAPPTAAYVVNPKLSITRIGTRAYPRALEQLAPQVRLDLAQADDARRFRASSAAPASAATSSAASGSSMDLGGGGAQAGSAAEARADALAQRLAAALLQAPGRPALLAEQVVTLYAVQRGFADSVPPGQVPAWLGAAVAHVAVEAPAAVEELGRTGILTAAAEAGIAAALATFSWRP